MSWNQWQKVDLLREFHKQKILLVLRPIAFIDIHCHIEKAYPIHGSNVMLYIWWNQKDVIAALQDIKHFATHFEIAYDLLWATTPSLGTAVIYGLFIYIDLQENHEVNSIEIYF